MRIDSWVGWVSHCCFVSRICVGSKKEVSYWEWPDVQI